MRGSFRRALFSEIFSVRIPREHEGLELNPKTTLVWFAGSGLRDGPIGRRRRDRRGGISVSASSGSGGRAMIGAASSLARGTNGSGSLAQRPVHVAVGATGRTVGIDKRAEGTK